MPPPTPPAPSYPSHLSVKKHANIVDVECLSDVTGSEGLVMEMALCDLLQASGGTSGTVFTLAQLLK